MTIQCTFKQGARIVALRIIQDNVLFIDLQTNKVAPIEGLRFDKRGVIIEYPDLKDNPDWKQISIQRFVDKLKQLPTEEQKSKWLISEMKKMGATPLYKQKSGFRTQKI